MIEHWYEYLPAAWFTPEGRWYVHQMQMLYDDMGATEVVEETFQHIFTTFLTNYDMGRVAKEVETMKREELN